MNLLMNRTSILLALTFVAVSVSAVDRREGGYAGTTNQGHDEVVYNFLKHFNYDQYYYAYKHQWTWNNNNRVDAMDIAVFGGHGNQWLIAGLDGSVDLTTAGSDPVAKNYGDWNAEFVAFESCDVVPSPLEVTDWYTNWRKPGGIFSKGLHQAVGFRTVSWQSTDQKITDYFGAKVVSGAPIWQSWFDAINAKGCCGERGAAVMHPSAEFDTHAVFVADPVDYSGSNFKIWYQY
jgi:hypothetical protein